MVPSTVSVLGSCHSAVMDVMMDVNECTEG